VSDPAPVDEHLLVAPGADAALDIDRLRAHLERAGLGLDDAAPRQFKGGLANLNFLVYITGNPFVLRRPPSGELPPGAHDMVREHRILSRLSAQFPLAPQSVHLCEDKGVLGVPFQLIEYRSGIVVRGDSLEGVPGHDRAEVSLTNAVVSTMAALHDVDPVAAGLDDLGRPDGFLARGVAGWVKRASLMESSPKTKTLVDEIGRWLTTRVDKVPHRAPTLLHCDFKLDNLILDPASLEPVAVIDWDMGTRGDPLFDLGTLLSYWTEPDDPPAMHRLAQMPTGHGGFATRAEVVEQYVKLTGADLGGFEVVRVLCVFKLAVVFLQLHKRWEGEDLLAFALDVASNRYD